MFNLIYKVYNRFFRSYIKYFKGKKYLQRFCADSEKYYLVTSHGIGDVAWMCVYLKAFLDANNINNEKVVILTQKKLYGIISLFYNGFSYIYCEKEELIDIQIYLSNTKNFFHNIKLAIFPLVRVDKLGGKEFELLSKAGADMDRLYRIGCFSLPMGTERVPQIRKNNINKNFEERKKIILVPYVNSRNIIPIEIWNKIVSILKKYDIEIYTNANKSEQCLNGTKLLKTDLRDIPHVIGENDLVIGGRCGLMDWLFIAQKNIIVLHSIIENNINEYTKARNNFAKWESFSDIKKANPRVFNQKFVKDVRLEIKANKETDLTEIITVLQNYYGEKEII